MANQRADSSATAYVPHEIYWPAFVQKLKAGDAYELRTDMMTWPVLFLDDIGADHDKTGYAAAELNALLGRREGKWTLLTSNKDAQYFKELDGRIYSRLMRGQNICFGIKTKDFSERQL